MVEKILIHEAEQHIVDAAIRLGDWLSQFPELTDKQTSMISNIQEKLKTLPEVETDCHYRYGYSIERGNDEAGLIRSWIVELTNSHKKDRRGSLEIFSDYSPRPMPTDAEMSMHESSMGWPVGKNTQEDNHYYSGEEWIAETSSPLQFFQTGDTLIIEIEVGNKYYKVPCKTG